MLQDQIKNFRAKIVQDTSSVIQSREEEKRNAEYSAPLKSLLVPIRYLIG